MVGLKVTSHPLPAADCGEKPLGVSWHLSLVQPPQGKLGLGQHQQELMIWCETLWLQAEPRYSKERGYINIPDKLLLLNILCITKRSRGHFHVKQQQEPRTKFQYSPCINSCLLLPQSTQFSFMSPTSLQVPCLFMTMFPSSEQ